MSETFDFNSEVASMPESELNNLFDGTPSIADLDKADDKTLTEDEIIPEAKIEDLFDDDNLTEEEKAAKAEEAKKLEEEAKAKAASTEEEKLKLKEEEEAKAAEEAKKAQLPWMAIKPHLEETLELARAEWPQMLDSLPMLPEHQLALKEHWGALHTNFKI